jgi:hypothetical protein
MGIIFTIISAACFGTWKDSAAAGWFMFFAFFALNDILWEALKGMGGKK